MIAGHPVELFDAIVVALGAAAVALIPNVTPQQVGAIVAVAFAVLGLLANKANTGSLLGSRR